MLVEQYVSAADGRFAVHTVRNVRGTIRASMPASHPGRSESPTRDTKSKTAAAHHTSAAAATHTHLSPTQTWDTTLHPSNCTPSHRRPLHRLLRLVALGNHHIQRVARRPAGMEGGAAPRTQEAHQTAAPHPPPQLQSQAAGEGFAEPEASALSLFCMVRAPKKGHTLVQVSTRDPWQAPLGRWAGVLWGPADAQSTKCAWACGRVRGGSRPPPSSPL